MKNQEWLYMDEKAIAIIVTRKDEERYQEQIRYLQELIIPAGYEASILTVDAGNSQAAMYQYAMRKSSAKYKIYIKPETFIINKYFLSNIVSVFRENDKVGIIGVYGTKQLSTTGRLSESSDIYGRILLADGTQLKGEAMENDIVQVMALSDAVIATQYDVDWREDIFLGQECGFLIESQCIEFVRNGYNCVVPQQDDYWVIAPSETNEYDIDNQNKFLDEYSMEIYPLVSVVIPTYQRINLFKQALESVLNQSYRNLDIFITDNSPGNQTAELVSTYQKNDRRITYEHHPDFDASDNWKRAIEYNNKQAEYVNWLMDDDVFLPEKISVMMDYFFKYSQVSLVTSYRRLIDLNGNFYTDAEFNLPIVDKTSIVSGDVVGKQILLRQINFIGEPTTALIKKRCMLNNRLGWTGREGKYLISDFPTWLRCMSMGDLIYIREPLSYFRIHEKQGQNEMEARINGAITWAIEIQNAINKSIFLKDDLECRKAIIRWFNRYIPLLDAISVDTFEQDNYKDLLKIFESMARALNNGYYIDFEVDTSA